MAACLPIFKACGRHVDMVDKSHLNLEAVPDEIMRYARTLEECNLEANQIKQFPKNFFRLHRLRYLNVSDNEISNIPSAFGNFSHLAHLDLSKNEICEISSDFQLCMELIFLDLSNNLLEKLPDGFCQFQKLRFLNLSETSIAQLPSDFGSLRSLEKLEMRGTILQELPTSFAELQQLQLLDFGGNEFMNFPIVITSLSNLRELFIDGNHLAVIPPEIVHLTKLQHLDVSDNEIDSLPVSLSGLLSLSVFNMRSNRMDSLPDCIGELKQLTQLMVENNQLMRISSRIGDCSSLKELVLSSNHLTKLPNEIGKLTKLSFLAAFQNRISELPSTIGNCEDLEILLLRDNRLQYLPEEIGQLQNLCVLDVAANRLLHLPDTLLQCPKLKCLWLSTNQANGAVRLQTEIDPNTGISFLTCFLLPQESIDADTDGLVEGNEFSPEHQSLYSANEEQRIISGMMDDESHRIRMHPKFDKKQVDGHVIAKDQTQNKETSFAPGRASPPPDKDLDENVAEIKNAILRKIAAPPGSRIVSSQSNDRTSRGVKSSHDSQLIDKPEGKEKGNGHIIHDTVTEVDENIIKGRNISSEHAARRTPRETEDSRYSGNNEDLEEEDEFDFASENENPIDANELYAETHDLDAHGENTEHGYGTNGYTTDEELLTVHIERPPNSGFGVSIAGGVGHVPYRANDNGIFVTKCAEDKPAYQCGLRVGDKLIHVNGVSLVNVDHQTAVSVLRHMGDSFDCIILRSKSENQNGDFQGFISGLNGSFKNYASNDVKYERINCKIPLTDENGVGFSIAGGKGSVPKTDPRWAFLESIYISKIVSGGAAEKCGQLQLGDKIIKINGIDVTAAQHDQAVRLLLTCDTDDLELELLREKPRISPKPVKSVSSPLQSHSNSNNIASALTNGDHSPTSLNMNSLLTKCEENEEIVIISRQPGLPLGLSLVGGQDRCCHPFGADGPGVFISKISPSGTASKCTNLCMGDRILQVNGYDIRNATHEEAVHAIVSAPGFEVVLHIRHEGPPPGLRRVTCIPRSLLVMGMYVAGGNREDDLTNVLSYNRLAPDPQDEGIFITRLPQNTMLSFKGLCVGQRILEIDDHSMLDATCDDVVRAFMLAGTEMSFLVCEGVSQKEVITFLQRFPRGDHSVDPSKYSPAPRYNE